MTYTRINILLPTRGRPERLTDHLDAAYALVGDPRRVAYTLLVDADDPAVRAVLDGWRWPFERQVIVRDPPGPPDLAGFYNRLYAETRFGDPATLVSMVGDDMRWETQDYDGKILSKMNEKNGRAIVYCDDAYIQHEKLCVNLFVSRDLVEATGKPFMCPAFKMNFIDTVWTEVGRKTGLLSYLPDVVLHHYHSSASKTRDTTHWRLQQQAMPTRRGYQIVEQESAIIAANLRKAGYHA